jgi:arylsulfatase A-like enzyme
VPPDLAELGGSTHRHLAGYFGMVERLDQAFGRLMDALESLELLESTIVLFTSDHGCHFRTRNQEYKRSPHDASLRVPALLTGPGFKGGGSVENLVSLVDLPPTLLEAAGLPVPEDMAGTSLVPLLQRRASEWRDEIFFQVSETAIGRGIRTQRWKYAVDAPEGDPNTSPAAAVYAERYLYDLEHDPYELKNLVTYPSHADVRKTLRAKLLDWIQEVEAEVPEVILAAESDPGYFDQRKVRPGEADL